MNSHTNLFAPPLAPDSNEVICPECGKPGDHWVAPMSDDFCSCFALIFDAHIPTWTSGFWTCDKFYDKNGRRISE